MREKMNGLSDKYIFSLLEFEKCNYDVAVRTWIDIFREDFCNEFREEIQSMKQQLMEIIGMKIEDCYIIKTKHCK